MAGGTKRTMICCICMQRIDATIVQAKAHGWTVWVGGAFCKRHVEADDEPLRAEVDRARNAGFSAGIDQAASFLEEVDRRMTGRATKPMPMNWIIERVREIKGEGR